MKKFILLAMLGIALAVYQPAKAQVSLSINIGSQPRYESYGYYTDYERPVVHHTYYAPAPRYVYVDRHKKYYKPTRVYRSSYSRPSTRYYSVKQNNYKHYNKSFKHGKGHGKGRH
ncbi:hypothetical protein FA048_09375 [Pedobacter polaris]|uniref:Virulence factor n=1 Tax=Pedobacter polaris TaxID=2571273 RepID=A0A4U1CTH8_9SPHI|nr:hypothetical protein [Pedobacter polaris]TKC10390.1 hypothetical protein FA048_09375 [Pedobacter polaris]